jgi:hypothetical protein
VARGARIEGTARLGSGVAVRVELAVMLRCRDVAMMLAEGGKEVEEVVV